MAEEITTREVAALMHVTVNTLRKYVERNQAVAALVRHRVIGHTRVWNLEDLAIYLEHVRGRHLPVILLDQLARNTSKGKARMWKNAPAAAKISAAEAVTHLRKTIPEITEPILEHLHQGNLISA